MQTKTSEPGYYGSLKMFPDACVMEWIDVCTDGRVGWDDMSDIYSSDFRCQVLLLRVELECTKLEPKHQDSKLHWDHLNIDKEVYSPLTGTVVQIWRYLTLILQIAR